MVIMQAGTSTGIWLVLFCFRTDISHGAVPFCLLILTRTKGPPMVRKELWMLYMYALFMSSICFFLTPLANSNINKLVMPYKK